MQLDDLKIYKLARIISQESWMIYNGFDWTKNLKILSMNYPAPRGGVSLRASSFAASSLR